VGKDLLNFWGGVRPTTGAKVRRKKAILWAIKTQHQNYYHFLAITESKFTNTYGKKQFSD